MKCAFSILQACLAFGFLPDAARGFVSPATKKPTTTMMSQAHKFSSILQMSGTSADFLTQQSNDKSTAPTELHGQATGYDQANQQDLPQSKPTFSTWKRRLVTREDPKYIHKLSNLVFVISTTVIMIIGAFNGFMDVSSGREILLPVTYIFLVSTAVQAGTSIDMAIKFRQNEAGMKDGFIDSAIGTLYTSIMALWSSPLAPEFMDRTMIVEYVMVVLATMNLAMEATSLVHSPQVIRELNAKKLKIDTGATEHQDLKAMIAYASVIILPSIFTVGLLWRITHCAETPRLDYLADCANGHFAFADVTKQQSVNFYALVFTTALAGYVMSKMQPKLQRWCARTIARVVNVHLSDIFA